ncbi:unnamed protein product [Rotaria sp. Silwood2]|nr:unnamed protein product [Rotaria sp. Silwood2]
MMVDQFHLTDECLNKIRQDAAIAVKNIESYAKDKVDVGTNTTYERGFVAKIEELKRNVNEKFDDLRGSVLKRRPSPGEANYSTKLSKYEEFLQHATTGISSMKRIFSELFAKLYDALKRILQWIYAHRSEIIILIASLFVAILPILLN